jgi:predicted nucleic acid-binding protein
VVKALFDTNVLIDYLNAEPQARVEIQRYTDKSISMITWMEVMVGADPAVEQATRAFLDDFELLAVDGKVAERVVRLRRNHRIRLPDAVIWATAQVNSMLLVTRNTKDFPANDPGVRLPYKL